MTLILNLKLMVPTKVKTAPPGLYDHVLITPIIAYIMRTSCFHDIFHDFFSARGCHLRCGRLHLVKSCDAGTELSISSCLYIIFTRFFVIFIFFGIFLHAATTCGHLHLVMRIDAGLELRIPCFHGFFF